MPKDEVLRKALDGLGTRLRDEPETLRAKWEAELVAEKGQEWVDQNRAHLDAEWPLVVQLFG